LQFSGAFNGRKSPRLEGLVLWIDGVFLDWRLDRDKVELAGIARFHPEYQGKSLRSFLPPAGHAGRFGGDRVRDSWRTAFPGFLR